MYDIITVSRVSHTICVGTKTAVCSVTRHLAPRWLALQMQMHSAHLRYRLKMKTNARHSASSPIAIVQGQGHPMHRIGRCHPDEMSTTHHTLHSVELWITPITQRQASDHLIIRAQSTDTWNCG